MKKDNQEEKLESSWLAILSHNDSMDEDDAELVEKGKVEYEEVFHVTPSNLGTGSDTGDYGL